MAKLLVVGLNPAWQKVYEMSGFSTEGVHRVKAMHQTASGKGINCARVLNNLGHDVTVLQVLGGVVGSDILKELKTAKIKSLHVEVEQNNRTCTTLVDTEAFTQSEVIEPFDLTEDVTEQLLALVSKSKTKYAGVIICGTYPKGLSPDIYSNILSASPSDFVLLDSTADGWSDIISQWESLSNEAEAKALKGQEFAKQRSWDSMIDEMLKEFPPLEN